MVDFVLRDPQCFACSWLSANEIPVAVGVDWFQLDRIFLEPK